MAAQGIAEAVQAYTGLSPAAAVTILALMLATYLLVSSLFVAPDAAPPKPPPQRKEEEQQQQQQEEAGAFVPYPDPVQVGEITLEQLAAYDGKDPAKPILIAIRGQVYDVTRGRWGLNLTATKLWFGHGLRQTRIAVELISHC